MGYAKIENLYRNQMIMSFKNVYALEKVHGTSAHIQWRHGKLSFYSGGETHDRFVELFDQNKLIEFFKSKEFEDDTLVRIHGEAYGGKQQGMSKTYGTKLCFIAFDVVIGGKWLDIPKAEEFVLSAGLEFVPYELVPSTVEALDKERDRDSIVAIRRGMGEGHIREGVVLRPPFEVSTNDGARLCAKHKRDEFREHKSPRLLDISPDKLKILEDAKAIAEEWCVNNRLLHVIQHLTVNGEEPQIKDIPKVLDEMMKDIREEAKGEFIETREAVKEIGKRTVELFKQYLRNKLHD